MLLILVTATVLYGIGIVLVLAVVLRKQKIYLQAETPSVSIIIAARNEEKRIKPTLESLVLLSYPVDKYEVIFVDDASTDKTADIIEMYTRERKNWRLIQMPGKDDRLKGKKAALSKAIEMAAGDIILTTDADCVVPETWISDMAALFDKNTTMVLGHALLQEKKGRMNTILQFDNLFSALIMASTTTLGFPMSSVGRNLAYRKEAYVQSGGYDMLYSHRSGDDVHLTELFRKKVKGKIRFNFNRNSFTYSRPPDTLKEILFQQVRKNSKILKKSWPSLVISLFLFIYHVLLLVFPFLHGSQLNTWLFILGSKLFIEWLTLLLSAKRFNSGSLIPAIPLMQLFYPLYVSFLGIAGIFQKYEWKK